MVWGGYMGGCGEAVRCRKTLHDLLRLSGGCGEVVWRVWGGCL